MLPLAFKKDSSAAAEHDASAATEHKNAAAANHPYERHNTNQLRNDRQETPKSGGNSSKEGCILRKNEADLLILSNKYH